MMEEKLALFEHCKLGKGTEAVNSMPSKSEEGSWSVLDLIEANEFDCKSVDGEGGGGE